MSSRLQQLLLSPLIRSRLANPEPLLIKTSRPDQSGVQPSGDFLHDVNLILRVINDDDSAKPLGLEKAQILVESALTAQVKPAEPRRIDAAKKAVDKLSEILGRIPPAQQDALNGVYTALATRIKPLQIKLASIPVREELISTPRKKVKPKSANQSNTTVVINRFDPSIEQIFIRISKLLRERNTVNEHELQDLKANLDQLINYVAESSSRKPAANASRKPFIHRVTHLAPTPKAIYEKLSAIVNKFKDRRIESKFDEQRSTLLDAALTDIQTMRDNPGKIVWRSKPQPLSACKKKGTCSIKTPSIKPSRFVKQHVKNERIEELTPKKSPTEIARLKVAELQYKAKEAQTRLNQLVENKIAVLKELNQKIERATTPKSRNRLIRDFCEQVDKLNHFVETERLTGAQKLLDPFIALAEKFKEILSGENPKKPVKEESKPAQLLNLNLRSLEQLKEKITKVLNKANGTREILISTFCKQLGELRQHAQPQNSKQLKPFVDLAKTWLSHKNLSTKERTLLQAV